MILPEVSDQALAELGRTEGGPDTLAHLVRDQDTRRLLVLRTVLDAVDGADESVCAAAARARVREDWALLVESDRVGPAGGRAAAASGAEHTQGPATRPHDPVGPRRSPARDRLLYPLLGPWAKRCLSGLNAERRGPAQERARELARDLAHFSTVAAAAAARAGLSFTVRLTARNGVIALPSLGTLHTAEGGDAVVYVLCRQGRLTIRQSGALDVVVYPETGVGAWSGSLAWTPAYALPGLVGGAAPMPLDDLDPYRTVREGSRRETMSGPVTLDEAERKRWVQAWAGTAEALRPAGEGRLAEAVALLRCLVPLAVPPGGSADGRGTGSCSATRREAFGALLSSTPPTPTLFAATLVHELNHAKLAALSDMATLHRAGPRERYFAPWRPDPRPFDGLLQGAYSHLALADFHQRVALAATNAADGEAAWTLHARYHAQVGAALPALVATSELTSVGRRFVDGMVATYERMTDQPAPHRLVARAEAYIRAARDLWVQRHGPGLSSTE
ncbi:aKG-HExxH-type peptide beta-hydroxylase [Streptomyces sp. NPDC004279]